MNLVVGQAPIFLRNPKFQRMNPIVVPIPIASSRVTTKKVNSQTQIHNIAFIQNHALTYFLYMIGDLESDPESCEQEESVDEPEPVVELEPESEPPPLGLRKRQDGNDVELPHYVWQVYDFYRKRLKSLGHDRLDSQVYKAIADDNVLTYLCKGLETIFKTKSSYAGFLAHVANTRDAMKAEGNHAFADRLPSTMTQVMQMLNIDPKHTFMRYDICPRRCHVFLPNGLRDRELNGHNPTEELSCPKCRASRYKVTKGANGKVTIHRDMPISTYYVRSIFDVIAELMAHPVYAHLVRYGYEKWHQSKENNSTINDFWDAKFAQSTLPQILSPGVMNPFVFVWLLYTDGTQLTKKGKSVVPIVARLLNLPPWVRAHTDSNFLLGIIPPNPTVHDIVYDVNGEKIVRPPGFVDSYDAVLEVLVHQFSALLHYGCWVKDAANEGKGVRVSGLLAAIGNDARAQQHAGGNAGPNSIHGGDQMMDIVGYTAYGATRYFSLLSYLREMVESGSPELTREEKALLGVLNREPDSSPVKIQSKQPPPKPWTIDRIKDIVAGT